jgi:hypothetical protein
MSVPVIETYGTGDSGGGTASTLSVAKPSGTAANDLLLMFVGSDDSRAGTNAIWTGPTSETWTELTDNQDGAVDCSLAIYWRIATGTEGANFTGIAHNSTDELWGICLRISGADTTTPIDASGTIRLANTTNLSAVGIATPVTVECLSVWGVSFDGGDTTWSVSTPTAYEPTWNLLVQHNSGTTGNDAKGAVFWYPLTGYHGYQGRCDGTALDGHMAQMVSIRPATITGTECSKMNGRTDFHQSTAETNGIIGSRVNVVNGLYAPV